MFKTFKASEDKTDIRREYRYDPKDLSVAFYRAAEKLYGANKIKGQRYGAGKRKRRPLSTTSVPAEQDESGNIMRLRGVSGGVTIEPLKADFQVLEESMAGTIPVISAYDVPISEQKEVERLLDEVEYHSIYKGKAISVTHGILNLAKKSTEAIVYNSNVKQQLETHVWTLLKDLKGCMDAGIEPQRKVLLYGPYGSGKTLTLFETARIATEHGWTVFYLPPTDREQNSAAVLSSVYDLAQIYQPAMVVLEDIDREQRYENEFIFGQMQNAMDGLASKGAHVFTLMTTNKIDQIGAALQRPGRVDKKIDFGTYTHKDIERLLRKNIPESFLCASIDWEKVGKHCKGFMPAFVYEVGTAAKLMAISKSKETGRAPAITTDILTTAADGLHEQQKNCHDELGKF